MKYVIIYNGLFENGSVTLWLFKKPKKIDNLNLYNGTKFRSKFIAKIICWLLNKTSEKKCDLRTFKIVPV